MFGSCFRILVVTCVSDLKIKIKIKKIKRKLKLKKSKRVLDSEQRMDGGGGWVISASCGTRQRDWRQRPRSYPNGSEEAVSVRALVPKQTHVILKALARTARPVPVLTPCVLHTRGHPVKVKVNEQRAKRTRATARQGRHGNQPAHNRPFSQDYSHVVRSPR